MFLHDRMTEAGVAKRPRLSPARIGALALAAAIVPAAPSTAQETPARTDDEIVVEGLRDPKKVIGDYVDGLTIARADQPLARYAEGEYCPAVLGLSEVRNQEIALRMRTVAAAAGVRPGGEGCATSALVIFVDDKDAFLRDFRARHPIYFTDLQGRGGGPPTAEGPAVAWQLVQLVDPQGMPVSRAIGEGYNIVESPAGGSRIRSMVTSVVAMAVVIVERRALVGLTATQIADYALMRTLSDRDPSRLGVPGSVTILGALDAGIGSAVPSSLTEWDLAYLKGRYSGDPARYGTSQGAAIRATMRRALSRTAVD